MAGMQQWTGAEAKLLRLALRMSMREYAGRLGVSLRTVSTWETRGSGITPQPEMQRILDTTLATADKYARGRFEAEADARPSARTTDRYGPIEPSARYVDIAAGANAGDVLHALHERQADPQSDEEVTWMALDRRKFLAGSGLLLPAVALELTRHDVQRFIANDHGMADVSEWQEISWDYGLSYMNTPPAELLRSLQVDLLAIGDALQRQRSEGAKRDLHKVSALLAAFTAQTVANLGDIRSSRRWWRTAKKAATESGDLRAQLWIRGREIMRALYEDRPINTILDLIAEAEAIGAGAPADTLPHLLCGKAQALALAGYPVEAQLALNEVVENFEHLAPQTVRDTDSLYGWSDQNVRFTESYVYSHLGDFARADRAQSAALALYSASDLRSPTQIELQRAFCMVRSGDVDHGLDHAHEVMSRLPRQHYIRPVVDLGYKVFNAVPAIEARRDSVQEFHRHLDSCASA